MSSSNLREGLQTGDLQDLILPMISIDEYESKIGSNEDVIVVAFFVEDKDPADDLARFLDATVTEIYDTDVSPAPTESGYFAVFIEIERNEEFAEKLISLLEEIEQLTEVDHWKAKFYKKDDLVEVTKETIEQFVRLDRVNEGLEEFFKNAQFTSMDVEKNNISIRYKKSNYKYILEGWVENYQEPPSCILEHVVKNNILDLVFGPLYNVDVTVNENIYITNKLTGKIIKLRDAK